MFWVQWINFWFKFFPECSKRCKLPVKIRDEPLYTFFAMFFVFVIKLIKEHFYFFLFSFLNLDLSQFLDLKKSIFFRLCRLSRVLRHQIFLISRTQDVSLLKNKKDFSVLEFEPRFFWKPTFSLLERGGVGNSLQKTKPLLLNWVSHFFTRTTFFHKVS